MAHREARSREPPGEVLTQLVDHHGRRNLGVVPEAASRVGHHERPACGEQCFQEREAVLVAQVAVAAPLVVLGEHIEGRRPGAAGETAIVHAHGAHDLRGERLPRPEAGHGHAVGEPRHRAARHLRRLGKRVPHDPEGYGRFDRALVLEVSDRSQHRFRLAPRLGVEAPFFAGEEPLHDRLAQPRRPRAGRAGVVQPAPQCERRVAVAHETSQQLEVLRAGVQPPTPNGRGRDPGEESVGPLHRVAEQQAPEAEPPTMSLRGRQVLVAPVRGVHAPADARGPNPVADIGEPLLRDAETRTHGGALQGSQHGLRAVAGARQREQVEQRAQPAGLAGRKTRHVERYPPGRREHRLDGRSVFGEARRHHQDVRGLDVVVLVEQGQQAVVQHLGLAHRGVADMNLQGRVGALRRRPPRRSFRSRAQVEDIPLHLAEDGAFPGRVVQLVRRAKRELALGEQRLHVPGGLAQRRKDLVAFGAVVVRGVEGFRPPPDDPFRRDVAPVLPTRAEEEEMDVDVRLYPPQHVEIGRRQHPDAEEARSPRPGHGRLPGRLTERIDSGDPVPRFGVFRGQSMPEARLPVRRPARLPVADPVRPIEQASVVDAREPGRESEAPGGIAVDQIPPHRRVASVRQRLEHAPPQPLRRERLLPRQRRHGLAHDGPRELRGEFDPQVRRDTEVPGEFQGEPAPQGGMRHDDAFGFERVARLLQHALGEPRGECLQAVAGVYLDAGLPTMGPAANPYSASNTAATCTSRPGRQTDPARSPRRNVPCSAYEASSSASTVTVSSKGSTIQYSEIPASA